MSDAAAAPAAKKAVKPRKPKAAPAHPTTAAMVNAAIKGLKERGGSSLPAIKKYMAANYKVDVQKLAPFIKKYLKKAVADGKLVQTKGKGASGSFKLGATATKEKKPKVKKVKKPAVKSATKAKKPKAKKVKTPKKKAAPAGDKPKKAAAAKPKKAKTPKKAKSPKKVKAAKPKKAKTPKKKAASAKK